jgi:hypothetical protein
MAEERLTTIPEHELEKMPEVRLRQQHREHSLRSAAVLGSVIPVNQLTAVSASTEEATLDSAGQVSARLQALVIKKKRKNPNPLSCLPKKRKNLKAKKKDNRWIKKIRTEMRSEDGGENKN